MPQQTKINCPNCGEVIDVNEILYHQLEDDLKKKYNSKLANVEKKEKELNKRIEKELTAKLKEKELEITKKLRSKFEKEDADKLKQLQDELQQQDEKLKDFKKVQIAMEKLKREKAELKDQIELDAQKQINQIISEEKIKIQRSVQEKNELKFKEYQKQLEDQKKLVEEMKRKAEQGSMQMQGEIQELAIEDFLRTLFPFDLVNEVSKGVRGADVIQTVVNRMQQACGKIIYESKRTKTFSNGWINKLKEDQRKEQADLAVIITEVMPKDMERFGRRDGVWICTFQEAKSVTFALREILIKTHSVKSAEENKGDKMELLYSYLTGVEFRQQVEAIVEGFTEMKSELEKEKRAFRKIWKVREKQIDKVISNTIDMHGAIKGIAGNAIQSVNALELPEPIED